MLKSSSLCLCSSNLGTFWLKIKQFWPFEEISIFSNGGHLGYMTALTDTILKGDHPRIISAMFGWDWLSGFRGEDFLKFHPPFFLICIIGKSSKFIKNPLLWNYWANLNQTLLKWFLDGPLPKLCPVIPTSNQDGRQAKNRKKGGWKFYCPLLL